MGVPKTFAQNDQILGKKLRVEGRRKMKKPAYNNLSILKSCNASGIYI